MTSGESIDAFTDEVAKRFGRIDVLVNNAGGARGLAPISESRDDEWIEMWEVNVLGLMRMTRACLPLIRKAPSGRIVNVSSGAGQLAVVDVRLLLYRGERALTRAQELREAARQASGDTLRALIEEVCDLVALALEPSP